MHTNKSRDRRNCLAMSYLSPKMSFLANSTPSRTTTRTIFTDGFCNKQTDWHYDGPDSRNNTVHERRPTTNHFFKTLLFNNILTREGFRPWTMLLVLGGKSMDSMTTINTTLHFEGNGGHFITWVSKPVLARYLVWRTNQGGHDR